jgi:hypothetical protein
VTGPVLATLFDIGGNVEEAVKFDEPVAEAPVALAIDPLPVADIDPLPVAYIDIDALAEPLLAAGDGKPTLEYAAQVALGLTGQSSPVHMDWSSVGVFGMIIIAGSHL